MPRMGFKEAVEARMRADEFDVQEDNFSALEIRPAKDESNFYYFYDRERGHLIKDFRVAVTPQVVTLCRVTLIRAEDKYTTRIRFWKRERGKSRNAGPTNDAVDGPPEVIVKASVDTGEGYEQFWTLMSYLQGLDEVTTSKKTFRVVDADSAQLADILSGRDRAVVLDAMDEFFGGSLTQADIQMLTKRREQLEHFRRLLEEDNFFETEKGRLGKRGEAVWQDFFESNPWIFGYGLNLVSARSFDESAKLEQTTTGHSLFQGGGKRSDAVMRSRGVISSLLFCEIKTHLIDLLRAQPYRPPDVYQVSEELSGAVSQVQKTADKAVRRMTEYVNKYSKPDGTPTGIEFSAVRPRQIVVIGSLREFIANEQVNPEKLSSFEFYRRGIIDVEIITFDELYQRAKFIVEDA